MRWPAALIGAAMLACLAALAQARQSPERATAAGYTGSAACQRCHEPEYETWRDTLHVQMTKPIAEARVAGDFGPGVRFAQYGRSYAMERRDDGRYVMSVAHGGRPAETFTVDYTLGARRFQGYLSKLPDGRIYVLPAFWHREAGRWMDWKEITPIPDDASHDLRQIWNITCVNCHATNLSPKFDPATKTYATTWTEMGVGCEACHGPGSAHVEAMNAREKSGLPSEVKIFSHARATPRQVFDSCGYCHGNKTNAFLGFAAGDRYEDFALPFLVSQPNADHDPQGDFWPDGRPNRFNRPQALTLSGCFQSGQATCTSCHRVHGTANDHALKVPVESPGGVRTRQSDTLCTQCHVVGAVGARGAGRAGGAGPIVPPATALVDRSAKALAERLEDHTHHAADSPGSRCIDCHMSDVNWRLMNRRRDHTFQPPVPELTARYGVPDACTTCHEDKSPEWAATTLDRWYGNGERRKAVVAVADVLYRAGAGDTSVLPDAARLAADRSHGLVIRASAAEFAAQLIAKSNDAGGSGVPASIANALIGAAADPEPTVRVMAIRALALTGDARAPAVVAARLGDEARLPRIAAAEALLQLGIARLEGAAGAALARAQDEWAASLRTFQDVAGDHTRLGWLHASRGFSEDAAKELRTAIALDPLDATPHVYLGVLAARESRFDAALQHFKSAKALSPRYRNLDRLIDEATKRATKSY